MGHFETIHIPRPTNQESFLRPRPRMIALLFHRRSGLIPRHRALLSHLCLSSGLFRLAPSGADQGPVATWFLCSDTSSDIGRSNLPPPLCGLLSPSFARVFRLLLLVIFRFQSSSYRAVCFRQRPPASFVSSSTTFSNSTTRIGSFSLFSLFNSALSFVRSSSFFVMRDFAFARSIQGGQRPTLSVAQAALPILSTGLWGDLSRRGLVPFCSPHISFPFSPASFGSLMSSSLLFFLRFHR